jgi:hypothetical protein
MGRKVSLSENGDTCMCLARGRNLGILLIIVMHLKDLRRDLGFTLA